MKISFVLTTVCLMASCLFFTCGCQNESAAAKSAKPPRVSYEAPPKTAAIGVSEYLALDKLVSDQDGQFDSKQVNWEEDVSQDSKKSAPPKVDEILSFESSEFGKLSGDGSEKDDFLKEASKR